MTGGTLAALAIVVPVLAALLLAALGWALPRWVPPVTLFGATIATAVLCALLLAKAHDAPVVSWLGGWKPGYGAQAPLGIALQADRLGAGLALFCALLGVAAAGVASPAERRTHLLVALVLMLVGAMVGFSLAGDAFTMFVLFELMGIAAFALAGSRIGERAPLEGALNFGIVNSLGGLLILFGIGLLYGHTGQLNLALLHEALLPETHIGAVVVVAFALMIAGYLVKAAIVPFHFWLADAYAVAIPPAGILFTGVLSDLGLYAVARLVHTAFAGPVAAHQDGVMWVLVVAGALTALLGGGMALVQTQPKRLLAFVTIASLGAVLIGVGLLAPGGLAGAALLVVADGCVRAAAFAGLAALERRRGPLDEVETAGTAREQPWVAGVLALAGLLVAGLPFAGSFRGKGLVDDAAGAAGMTWLHAVTLVSGALAGAALLRAAWQSWRLQASVPPTEPDPGARAYGPAIAAGGLLAGAVVVGAWAGLEETVHTGAGLFTDAGGYAAAALTGHVPPLPAAAVRGGHALGHLLTGLGGVLLALLVAAAAERRVRRRAGAPRLVVRVLHGVRGLHSGHPGDYVAWLAAGAAAFGASLLLVMG